MPTSIGVYADWSTGETPKKLGTLQAREARAADYLLGVHDTFRSGALRYKRDDDGPFLDDRDGSAAPPFVLLRELEAASRAIEAAPDSDDPAIDEWLRLLLAPGASLGGARPKATVADRPLRRPVFSNQGCRRKTDPRSHRRGR